MPYLGNVPAEAYTNTVKDSFNGDASTTAFTLSQPSTTNNLRVVVENVIQDPTVAYTVSGTTLTFTSAPPVGTANIYAVHLGPATQTAVPPSEINNATTYTSDLTVQGAFTSAGIDDNADATAMTIDSSENVLVGTTTRTNLSNGTGNTGHSLDNAGQARHTADSGEVMFLNRLTDDGDIAVFRRDGSTVTTIGFDNSYPYIVGGAAGSTHAGLRFINDQSVRPANSTGANLDNSLNLGASTARFKNLYLSGGVYLGGTGSSNLLDDVEFGSYTPTVIGTSSAGTVTYVERWGEYTKIGDTVTVWFYVSITAHSGYGGSLGIGNLPFTSRASRGATGSLMTYGFNWTTSSGFLSLFIGGGQTYIRLFSSTDDNAWAAQGPRNESYSMYGTLTYKTDS